MKTKESKISLLIPAYNEEQNIPVLYAALIDILKQYPHYEIIFIDDGSTDATIQCIKKISTHNENIHYISFSRNFGQQRALRAGMDFASGDCVISMDADLQHPPDLIPLMIEKWTEGFDIVYTERIANKSVSLFKKATSKIFYILMNLLGDSKLDHGTADFRLLDRHVVNHLKKLHECDLYYKAILPWIGFKQTKIPYQAHKRFAGKTKWSFIGLVKLAILGITSFSAKPLIIPFFLGMLSCIIGTITGIYTLCIKFFMQQAPPTWLPLSTIILFIGGLQFCCIGILGIYLGQVHNQVKGRPLYIINESNFSKNS